MDSLEDALREALRKALANETDKAVREWIEAMLASNEGRR